MFALRALYLIPLHIIPCGWYALIALGQDNSDWLGRLLLDAPLPSGGVLTVTTGDAFVALSVVILFLEILKSTSSGWGSIGNHGLSMILLIVCFGAFLTAPAYATSAWMIMTFIVAVDTLGGSITSIVVARRDFSFGPG